VKAPLQLTMAITPDHRNQYLFSDHYLNNLLCQDPRWDAALPEAETFLAWLQELYAREQGQLAGYNESQLQDHWFRPILSQLGHVFEGQATVPGLDAGVKRPDYVFFPDERARQAAVGAQSTAEYTAEALTVGEVKRWNTPLGKKRKGGEPSFENQNPSWQIDYYLRATNLDWGILTDGRMWRLVHEDTSQRLSIYYEVDLVELLSRSDAGALRYFTLFFRQAAFRPDALGRTFLDDALAASNAYAVALEEDLEENVYRALELLMQGFLNLPANGLGANDLREIYDNSLYLLYRLLFILYGESRGLLPMHNDQYREQYSLQSIEREIAAGRAATASLTTVIWRQLETLFHIINGDDAELNRSLGVPRYNGGLFDPQQHPFLDNKAVGDQALGQAIDLLSRRETEEGREFVDYRSLGVRHLGSIYERLLEYQPHVKISEVSNQVYLETDRGERKATGSYYTPQYIVEYIVEHTLGPLVEEASGQALVDAVLNLKVLDPSMGSGHFLVEATEFLALALATDPNVETESTVEEDLTHWKRRVVERCIYGVDKNPLAVELAKLSLWLATVAADRPLSFLDHHLKCGDSLIGARVDDLGEVPPVMLSKKVLRERQARYEAGVRQANLFETRLTEKLPVVMGRILEIAEVESKDYDTVRAKEGADRAVRQLKAPFQAVADLWVSGYFGNEFINGEYDEALMHIGQPEALMSLPAVLRARAMAEERRFFHWELAFPEVFYDRHGRRLGEQAGFDAVVGNPPYVSYYSRHARELSDSTRQYYVRTFGGMVTGSINTFLLFLGQGIRLAKDRQYVSFIVPDTLAINERYETMRRFLFASSDALRIAVLRFPVFDDPTVRTVVTIIRVGSGVNECIVELYQEPAAVGKPVTQVSLPTSYLDNRPNFTIPLMPQQTELENKVRLHSDELSMLCNVRDGINPGPKSFREQIVIKTPVSRPTIKPLICGSDIERYYIDPPSLWVDYDQCLLNPDLKRQGASFREEWIFTSVKLASRQTSDHLVFAKDTKALYDLNSVHNTIKLEGVNEALGYLLTLLNSRLMQWYYVAVFQETRDVFPQVHISAVRQLPIRRIEFTTPADEREQLAAQAKAKAEESVRALAASGVIGSDTPMDRAMLAQAASPALGFVEERLAAEPEQADVVHDLLAHLAERMIEMHKQKQAHVEDFWLDLEGAADDDAFEILRHKGKQERTLWRKSEAGRPFVSEESHSTRRLDESLAWNEGAFKAFVKALAGKVRALSGMVNVYRAHSPAYRELVARIAATDWLIDQIVYELYGLTEEEITIVEGKRE